MSLRITYKENDKTKLFEAKKEGKEIMYTYNDWKTSEKGERKEVNDIVKELRKTFEVVTMIGTY